MEKLTKAEEPIMHWIWKLKKVFVKDIIEKLSEPKPPYNTVSSIVRILAEKGMVGFESFGRTHQYFPLVTKVEYRAFLFKSLLKEYFDGSPTGVLSHIVENEKLSEDEIEEIEKLIQQKKSEGHE